MICIWRHIFIVLLTFVLRWTLQSLIAFPKLKRQVLLCDPEAKQPKDFTDNTMFWVNQEFGIMWVEKFDTFCCAFLNIFEVFTLQITVC